MSIHLTTTIDTHQEISEEVLPQQSGKKRVREADIEVARPVKRQKLEEMEFPIDILRKIFLLASKQAESKIACVCKQWNTLIHSHCFTHVRDFVVVRRLIPLDNGTTKEGYTIACVWKASTNAQGHEVVNLQIPLPSEIKEALQTDIITRIIETGDKTQLLDKIKILDDQEIESFKNLLGKFHKIIESASQQGSAYKISGLILKVELDRSKFLKLIKNLFYMYSEAKRARDYCLSRGNAEVEVSVSLDDSEEYTKLPFKEWDTIFIEPLLGKLQRRVERLAEEIVTSQT